MKYIVAVKYVKSKEKLDTRIFEFSSQRERSSFIKSVRPLAKDFALSQIDEKE